MRRTGVDVWTSMVQGRPGQHWFARAVLGFDAWLRRRNGVYEYSDHPHCAFRMQIVRVRQEIALADGTHLHPGDRVIELHIWNEQFPCFSAAGATLSWGRQVNRRVEVSLRELARYLAVTAELADVRAIRADTRLAGRSTTAQLLRICRRYGLERGPDLGPASPPEWLRRLGENIFIALLVLARNAGAFRPDGIWRDRVQMFLPRADLERRYGPQKLEEARNSTCEGRISVPQSLQPSPSIAPDCSDSSTSARPARRGNAEYSLKWHIGSAR
jgi:hypothetical protein